MNKGFIAEGIPSREVSATKKYLATKKLIGAVLIFLVLLIYATFIFSPFYTILVTSITGANELNSVNHFIWFPTQGLDFEGFKNFFTYTPMPDEISSEILYALGNTFFITIVTSVSSLFFAGMAAFSYSKLHFKGKNILFMLELTTMMIPAATMVMPSFIFYDSIGWTEGWKSYLPIIVPALFGGASSIFFLRSYMSSIPNEIFEAAKIDGLSPFKTYVKIMMPNALPAFIAQFIFSFVANYNAYLKPLLYLSDDATHYTLQIFLSEYSGTFKNNPNFLCASALIAILPLVIIFIICQKFFIEGISVGGGKE